jgi:general stress protein CsbA
MTMTHIQLTGIFAIIGAFLYAIGDVLLLASKVNLDEYPKLKPFAKLLSDAEKMVVLSPNRVIWGALLGVFATPLVVAGYWQIYQGLGEANAWVVLTTISLFGSASIIGAFVHGTFYYMGEYVQALNQVDEKSQDVIAKMIERHKKVLIISYAPILFMILVASVLFAVLVASGKTAFASWMIYINPVTLTIAWLVIKKVLPKFIVDWTEGAGFNIAYIAFFICTTISLWNI